MSLTRRAFLRAAGQTGLGAAFWQWSLERSARASAGGRAARAIFFYFPDGVAGPSQAGEPTEWHAQGSERSFTLGSQMSPLERRKSDCVFFNGLSMGPADSGSHPGGAKKLLTAVDGGNGESIDQLLARTAGRMSPHRHLYLGAMANADNASGDKHISYPAPGQTTAPEDSPLRAFERLFGTAGTPATPPPSGGPQPPARNPKATVIDAVLADLNRMRARLGQAEKRKLDLHLEALREVEGRIKAVPPAMPPEMPAEQCGRAPMGVDAARLYQAEHFPAILRAQIDLMVQAMACQLTQVGVIQASHHTSELIMSRFPGTPMFDPGFDMRSHQASHYGARHDPMKREYRDYVAQRRWWVEQFAYLLDQLAARREGDGTMLDNSVILLCSEVCDGNTHLHDDMPFVLAGRAGGAIDTGRLLQGFRRHADLLAAIAHAMGERVASFGDTGGTPYPGLVRQV